jgi:predicted secreted protein
MAIGADGRWHASIGDPSIGGWITVAGYFGTALLAYRALRLHHTGEGRPTSPDRRTLVLFWFLVLCAMLLLGINKQLDLQSWFTQVGRDLAAAQGWYQERHSVQTTFIAALVLAGLIGMTAMALWLRRVFGRVAGAVLGLGFLVTFVAVRAASFHHIDRWLGYGVVRLNWVLELGGIALVALSALRQVYTSNKRAGEPN